MADIQWPTGLPQNPIKSNFSQTYGVNVARTQMDVGPAKVRRRHTATIEVMSIAFEMTTSEVAIFDTFYKTTSADGTKRFDFTHPRTGVLQEWRFRSEPEIEYLSHDAYVVRCEWEKLP